MDIDKKYNNIIKKLENKEDFDKKYPNMDEITYGSDAIYSCGYPDYMYQSTIENTYIIVGNIPNTDKYIFQHNKYIGEPEYDTYKSTEGIISKEEKEIVLEYWKEIQKKHELEFEELLIESINTSNENEENKELEI